MFILQWKYGLAIFLLTDYYYWWQISAVNYDHEKMVEERGGKGYVERNKSEGGGRSF